MMDFQADTLGGAVEWRIANALVPYNAATATMEARVAAIHEGHTGELVWLLEHPPLYTAGTSALDAARLGFRAQIHHGCDDIVDLLHAPLPGVRSWRNW